MKVIDGVVLISLMLICVFIFIDHVWLGVFSDTAFRFSLLYPVWVILYAMIVMIKRGEL